MEQGKKYHFTTQGFKKPKQRAQCKQQPLMQAMTLQ